MYYHTNKELNEMLGAEGFKADLDEEQELELGVAEVLYDDEFEGVYYEL